MFDKNNPNWSDVKFYINGKEILGIKDVKSNSDNETIDIDYEEIKPLQIQSKHEN